MLGQLWSRRVSLATLYQALSLPASHCQSHASHPPSARLTGHSFAAVGVATAGCVALYTQTLVTAVGVDAELAAGESGAALVHIGTGSAIIL